MIRAFLERKQDELFRKAIQRHSDEVENIYKQMRGWRHDYHNHIQVLRAHLAAGQVAEADNYLQELESDLTLVDTLIKTGNVMIDAILTAKLSLAKTKNIEVDAAALVPAKLSIAPVDVCIIVGNLLDNAIEANELLETGRFIRVYIGLHKEMFYVSVANATGIQSKKQRSRGIGLTRIDKIAKKYGGFVNRQKEPGVYATEIMLPLTL